jgi:hypothetical protein
MKSIEVYRIIVINKIKKVFMMLKYPKDQTLTYTTLEQMVYRSGLSSNCFCGQKTTEQTTVICHL